jgi:hypothetical protein
MLKILALPWNFLKYLTALALPMFAGPGAAVADAANPAGRWAARLLLMGGFLVLLGMLNRWEMLGLSRVISGGWISRYWLPLFAVCLYAMAWLGWLLWRALGIEIEAPTSDYPDIDEAWAQAAESLDRAGIHLDETPLYLILGWTGSSEEALFRSAGIRALVKQVPGGPESPLRVTAGRDAVWVTCPGASLLGQVNPAVGGGGGGGDYAGDEMMTMSGGSDDPFKTVGAGGGGETLRIEDFMAQIKSQGLLDPKPKPRRRGGLELEPSRSRLRHLCQLIAQDRKGFCPINGVLVVLPITAVDSPGDVEDVVTACRNDLAVAFESYKLRCTILVLVAGIEKLSGFSDLVERLPQGQAGKRMGQRFPLNPDLKPAEVPARIESSVEWIGGNLFPSMVHSMFQVEAPGGEDVEDVMRTNANLYRFMMEVQDRQSRLGSLIRECIPPAVDEPLLFGGCYFAGTGEDAATGQAFAPGVLKRLVEEQDNVTWTDRALEQDASSQHLAKLIKAFLIAYITLAALASLGLIAMKVFGGSDEV